MSKLQTVWANTYSQVIDKAITQHKRWQHAFTLEATQYERAHGASETSRKIPVGIDNDLIRQFKRFQANLIGAAAVFYKPTMTERERDAVALEPWTEGMQLAGGIAASSKSDPLSKLSASAMTEGTLCDPQLVQLIVEGVGDAGHFKSKLQTALAAYDDPKHAWLLVVALSGVRVKQPKSFDKLDPATIAKIDHLAAAVKGAFMADVLRNIDLGAMRSRVLFNPFLVGTPADSAFLPSNIKAAFSASLSAKARPMMNRNLPLADAIDQLSDAIASDVKALGEEAVNAWLLGRIQEAWVRGVAKAVKPVEHKMPQDLGIEKDPLKAIDAIDDKFFRKSGVDASGLKQLRTDIKETSGFTKKKARAQLVTNWVAERSLQVVFWQYTAKLLEGLRQPIDLVEGEPDELQAKEEDGRIYYFSATKRERKQPEIALTGKQKLDKARQQGLVEEAPSAIEAPPAGDEILPKARRVKSANRANIGHLFLDMKDFTSKTAQHQDLDMAEFMRWDFYDPLLKAAKKHYQGLSTLLDNGGLFVNNLLGDALSLCGDVGSLLEFSRDADAILRGYEDTLRKNAILFAQLDELKQELLPLESDMRVMYKQYQELVQQAKDPAAPVGVKQQLDGVKKQYAHMSERRRQLQMQIQKTGGSVAESPEFGIYIGFGTIPVYIEFEDDAFGKLGVAIAEKINEAARGTARAGVLWASVKDAFASAKNDDKALKDLAFRVYVGQQLSVDLTPQQQDRLMAAREAENDELRQKVMSEAALKSTDVIYNAGIALSQEALYALIEGVGEHIEGVRCITLSRTQAAKALQPYWTPDEELQLIGYEFQDQAWVFRVAGSMTFKGFEAVAAKKIYEYVSPVRPGYQQLWSALQQADLLPVAAGLTRV